MICGSDGGMPCARMLSGNKARGVGGSSNPIPTWLQTSGDSMSRWARDSLWFMETFVARRGNSLAAGKQPCR